ncbi:MAG: amylo-alpha-1,6-glucosidase [Candidatus Altiarchaeota archaeon]
MQIEHIFERERISKNSEDAAFLLTNKNLGYCYFSEKPKSRYEGVFFQINGKVFRVIAEIGIKGKLKKIINRFYEIERICSENSEKFFIPFFKNSLVYELKKSCYITLKLDIRGIYSQENFGRYYSIFEENGKLIVKYTKKNEIDGSIEYETYLVIHGAEKYEKIDKWEKVFYERDKERNSWPFELYIYSALRIKAKRLIFCFSENKDKATKEADDIAKNTDLLKEMQRVTVMKNLSLDRKKFLRELKFAYLCCLNSLNQLRDSEGIIAGLPWFFQHWTRDELVTMSIFEPKERKKILLKYLKKIKEDGRVENILNSEKTNADSVGWLFKRISENLVLFSPKEKKIIADILEDVVDRLQIRYMMNGFIYNEKCETWMDTSFADDKGRDGARIEIQAMFLNMLLLAYKLTGNEKYKKSEERLREKLRRDFWNGKILADGFQDFTIRPNIFLAFYIYPKILSREEWEICFENSLKKLWCNWGGISTIDKEHHLFFPKDTGEDPRSYHRGNSWFYLNNLTALSLHRINKKKFKRYIEKILDASTKDILWNGAISHHSELSSAGKLSANGCVAQAWSAATYIEAINEIFG